MLRGQAVLHGVWSFVARQARSNVWDSGDKIHFWGEKGFCLCTTSSPLVNAPVAAGLPLVPCDRNTLQERSLACNAVPRWARKFMRLHIITWHSTSASTLVQLGDDWCSHLLQFFLLMLELVFLGGLQDKKEHNYRKQYRLHFLRQPYLREDTTTGALTFRDFVPRFNFLFRD